LTRAAQSLFVERSDYQRHLGKRSKALQPQVIEVKPRLGISEEKQTGQPIVE
tara:strand:+ start:317 stop:472 length:156 start_codon:yes stop_codon:yes gene_type:complete